MNLRIWLDFGLIILGLIGLWRASDLVVCILVALARRANISTFFLGFVILALAADIPELALVIVSVLKGASQISVGNIVGANFTDIALVVGATLLLAGSRMTIQESDRKMLFMLLAFTSAILCSVFWIGTLYPVHGIVLIMIYFIVSWWLWRNREYSDLMHVEGVHDDVAHYAQSSYLTLLIKLFSGVSIIMGSSWLVVQSAIVLAGALNLSLETIGAVICGIGTSLPELALSIGAIRRQYYTLAIGPTLGTVLGQTTLILGTLCCFSSEPIQLHAVGHAVWFMFAALALIGFGLLRVGNIGRGVGAALISLFVTFLVYHVQ